MTPPKLQMSLQLRSAAGRVPIKTVGTPGTHGPAVVGMQGAGVGTPMAAAVAAATAGFAGQVHIPNGTMFTKGALSMMLATGGPART
jgi:hypothetical protein